MSHQEDSFESRRRFLKIAAGTATAVVVLGGLPKRASAGDLPHLGGTDPTARALGYVEDATTAKNAMYKAGDTCANCKFYNGPADGYGPCELFPGKGVNAKGWCSSYTRKKA
jgi:high potential iron-sulfur protein